MDVDGDDAVGFIGSLEPSAEDYVSEILLQQLGSFGRSYRREARQSCSRLVSEMYSPPRVTAELKKSKKRFRHVLPGFAFDLTVSDPDDGQPWDFSIEPKRRRARGIIRQYEPFMLVGSPELGQLLKRKAEATHHLNVVVSLYIEQI